MRHDNNAFATMLLMSQMVAGKEELVTPLSVSEYYALRQKVQKSSIRNMENLMDMDMSGLQIKLGLSEEMAFRVCMLLNRMLPLSLSLERFYIDKLEILTMDDEPYPRYLRERLGVKAPPMFYTAGRTELLRQNAIAIVGGMKIDANTKEIVQHLVADAVQEGYAIVTEGGTDVAKTVLDAAQKQHAFVIQCVADSLARCVKTAPIPKMLENREIVCLSVPHPDTLYTPSHALMRNKVIYGLSRAAFVIAADDEKGITWEGAAEALKYGYCKNIYTLQDAQYSGNRKLLTKGAKVFADAEWSLAKAASYWAASSGKQLSLFDHRME